MELSSEKLKDQLKKLNDEYKILEEKKMKAEIEKASIEQLEKKKKEI